MRTHGLLFSVVFPLLTAGTTLAEPPSITHGVATGDVTATSVIVWARSDAAAEMVVELGADPELSAARRASAESATAESATAESAAAGDFAAQVTVDGLEPATRYHYSVTFENADGTSQPRTGAFTTAPAAAAAARVRFIVGGDVGGQGYCRHAEKGYDIFAAMAELEPDFFVANGDMIYADNACPAAGPDGWPNVPGDFPSIDSPGVDWTDADEVREIYLAHWRYNRADPHAQAFHARVPVYVQWDDHEVINDFGSPWASWPKDTGREGYPNLVRAGRDALFAWNPMTRHSEEPHRVYRSFRWGRDVELFLLDARSYRSLNDLAERPDHAKTMLGRPQLDWLLEGLRRSEATWKIVSSDVPLSVPTGSQADLYGRDGFADGNHPWEPAGYAARTGFETELAEMLTGLDAGDVDNVVFVVTDVHFAMSLRYEVDLDGDGDALLFHELLSGPLNAGLSPVAPRLDPTLGPVTLYAETGVFNFSYVRVERQGAEVILIADVRGPRGQVRFGSRLELRARPASR